jgi:hypothetical protein
VRLEVEILLINRDGEMMAMGIKEGERITSEQVSEKEREKDRDSSEFEEMRCKGTMNGGWVNGRVARGVSRFH